MPNNGPTSMTMIWKIILSVVGVLFAANMTLLGMVWQTASSAIEDNGNHVAAIKISVQNIEKELITSRLVDSLVIIDIQNCKAKWKKVEEGP